MDPERDKLKKQLKKLQHAVGKGNKYNTKEIIDWFHQGLARNKQILTELYTSGSQCTTQTDLILAACENRQADILYYILNETDILVHLTDDSLNDTEVIKQRTEVFRHALRSGAIDIIEMLYDYWCGNLHWIGHDMNNIEMVGTVLKDAYDAAHPDADLSRDICFSLAKLNIVQRKVYVEIAKLKPCEITPENTAAKIRAILGIHEKYSNVLAFYDASAPVEEEYKKVLAGYVDDSGIYYKVIHYMKSEVYFRKLDFNISLLILDNLNILRKHLKKRFNKTESFFKDNPDLKISYKDAAESYKDIESKIYYFIYRTSENWRLYALKKHMVTVTFREEDEGVKSSSRITFDLFRVESVLVIYIERENFRQSLKNLEEILRIHVVEPALAGSGTQIRPKKSDNTKVVPLLDDNYLQTVTYMNDHYSLLKMTYYIEAIENTYDVDVLMIERALHVIGEMLKSTDDSCHLSRSTKALLQIAISVETVRHLHNIRDFLSKANKGQLSARIGMTNTQDQTLFYKIKEDLIRIKNIIYSVLDILKCILDKSLLEKGYNLLEQRTNELPEEARRYNDELSRFKFNIKLELESEWEQSLQFLEEVWKPTGLSDQLIIEVPWTAENKKIISSKLQKAKERLSDNVVNTLPSFIRNVKQMLNLMKINNKYVEKINIELSKYNEIKNMCDCPDGNEICRIQNQAARLFKKNKKIKIDLNHLQKIKNYNHHWDSIKGMLAFCFKECELFASISHLNLSEDCLPDTQTVTKVTDILLPELEAVCKMHRSTLTRRETMYRWYKDWQMLKQVGKFDFIGIEELHKFTEANQKKPDDLRTARGEVISCLIKRLDQLKQILLYLQPIPLNQQVQRFNRDEKFRITLEMILADIANVLAMCNIRLMNKSSNLLREIDLGNVLDHGNPFLEVIGKVFNSHDYAAELLVKATMFAEDGQSIEALYELFKGNVAYETIIAGDLEKNEKTKLRLYEQFKKSPNWMSYAKLTCYPKPKLPK